MDQNKVDDMWSELHGLLKDMDVPPDRFNDINWLNRNFGIRNQNHPKFPEAKEMIRNLFLEMRTQIRKDPINNVNHYTLP